MRYVRFIRPDAKPTWLNFNVIKPGRKTLNSVIPSWLPSGVLGGVIKDGFCANFYLDLVHPEWIKFVESNKWPIWFENNPDPFSGVEESIFVLFCFGGWSLVLPVNYIPKRNTLDFKAKTYSLNLFPCRFWAIWILRGWGTLIFYHFYFYRFLIRFQISIVSMLVKMKIGQMDKWLDKLDKCRLLSTSWFSFFQFCNLFRKSWRHSYRFICLITVMLHAV